MADSKSKSSDKSADSGKVAPAPQVGGVSDFDSSEQGVFSTSGNQPVRDKEADPKKGTPVTRFFTKDGTPVEPTTVPPAKTPANLAGQDPSKRDDVVAAVEYLDEGGNTVTHDMLEGKDGAGHEPSLKK